MRTAPGGQFRCRLDCDRSIAVRTSESARAPPRRSASNHDHPDWAAEAAHDWGRAYSAFLQVERVDQAAHVLRRLDDILNRDRKQSDIVDDIVRHIDGHDRNP